MIIKKLKFLLSLSLYHIGDIISLTIMRFGNGHGYSLYRKAMLWSCDLDDNCRIWKKVKSNRKKNKK